MDHRAKVIKKHLNAVAKQMADPPKPTRFDEPNMPLESTPDGWYDTTPSSWQFSMQDLLRAFYNGVESLKAYIEKWLISLGLTPNVARILTINLTITSETIYTITAWILRPGSTNLPRDLFQNLLREVLWELFPPNMVMSIDSDVWDTFYYFENRGVFLFGEIASAVSRGWTLQQIISWLKFSMERMMNDGDWTFYWPETAEEAQDLIDSYGENNNTNAPDDIVNP